MTKDQIEQLRPGFEAAIIERFKESGFLEVEIRVECLSRCGESYNDPQVAIAWWSWTQSRESLVVELPDEQPGYLYYAPDVVAAIMNGGGGIREQFVVELPEWEGAGDFHFHAGAGPRCSYRRHHCRRRDGEVMSASLNVTDRKLLELAAKAAGWTAGFVISTAEPDVIITAMVDTGSKIFGPWNPLTDDGDALRLVMALDMTVNCNRDELTVIVQLWNPKLCKAVRSNNSDADVRRAIVEVAAMKGKLMP